MINEAFMLLYEKYALFILTSYFTPHHPFQRVLLKPKKYVEICAITVSVTVNGVSMTDFEVCLTAQRTQTMF